MVIIWSSQMKDMCVSDMLEKHVTPAGLILFAVSLCGIVYYRKRQQTITSFIGSKRSTQLFIICTAVC